MIERIANTEMAKPTWPEPSSLATNEMRFTYDRPTETLFVDFHGEARPATSIPLDRGDRDYLYLRVTPDTNTVVGFQIEHVLSYAIEQHPELADALDIAALVGIDRDELHRIVRVHPGRPKAGNVTTLIADFRRLSA